MTESVGSEKNISVEQGYNICLFFYNKLWPSIEPKSLELDDHASTVHMLFFTSTCMGFECSALWNEAVFRITKISKKEQRKGLMLNVEEVLLCTIEFCNVCKDLYNWDLGYTLDLVKSMRANPQNHPFEWSIWTQAVDTVLKTDRVFWRLDWNRYLA